MGRSQRLKGANWERAVARQMAEATGLDVRRTGGQSRKGTDAPDVEAPGIWIEAKVGASPSPTKAMEQGEKASDGRPTVAVCKRDRYPATATMRLRTACVLWGVADVGMRELGPLVTMGFDDFVRLYARVYGVQA